MRGKEERLPGFHRTAAERVRLIPMKGLPISDGEDDSPSRRGVPRRAQCFGAAFLWRNFRWLFARLCHVRSAKMDGDNSKKQKGNKRRCVPIGTNAKEAQTLINEAIDVREVRVVDAEGQPLGIMSSREALRLAYDKDLDLVLIAPQAQPPVCKIMDYGKYCFEKQKREKEAKKKQQTVELKEIQISYRIDTHDYETKVNQARKFLSSGNKVRVVMKFRGREMSHMAMGRDVLDKFLADTAEVGSCDKKPVLEGRFMSMVINPIPNKAK